MRRLLLLLIIFNISSCFSQLNSFEKPNYKKIRKSIRKKKSDYNYYKLFKKFNNLNSNMTLKEKRYLYYGYVFQKNYEPFGFTKYRDSLNLYASKKTTKNNLTKMILFSEYILSKNPFNIEVLTYKAYLHKKNRDDIGYKRIKKQLKIIFDAILSSGNGRTKEAAYHIIYRTHKKAILKHKKLKFNGIRKTIDKYRIEYLNVGKNDFGIRGVYFNVSAFKINLKSKK
jgi:hypothetical protein